MQGALDADSGSLSIPAGWRIASVEQEITAHQRAASEFVMDGDVHLRALQAERAATPHDRGQRIAEMEAELFDADAWSAPSRAEQPVAGLGYAPEQRLAPGERLEWKSTRLNSSHKRAFRM